MLIGYEKQKPMQSALFFKWSRFDANCAKNSFLESSFSTPGILVFSISEMEASPFPSNVTRQERKFVPPASMTITLLLTTFFSGGRQYVLIISSSLFFPARPLFISSKMADASTLTFSWHTKLCLVKKEATAAFIRKILV